MQTFPQLNKWIIRALVLFGIVSVNTTQTIYIKQWLRLEHKCASWDAPPVFLFLKNHDPHCSTTQLGGDAHQRRADIGASPSRMLVKD